MVYQDGEPVMLNEQKVQRTLLDGDRPRIVAGRLTREIRKTMRGDQVEGFDRPIDYAVAGFA